MGLRSGLARLRGQVAHALSQSDLQQIWHELERGLLAADAGTAATRAFVAGARNRAGESPDLASVGNAVHTQFAETLERLHEPEHGRSSKPHIIMLVGANGSGKTTTCAKIGRAEIAAGGQVVLAACDTFRAAAGEQLAIWADRLGDSARIVTGDREPASVAYNATVAAQSGNASVALIDTAGRQSNNRALMAEAQKIKRAIGKAMPGAPHDVILTLDANTGQNALAQLQAFDDAVGVTALAVTKLDSTARGGVLLAIAAARPRPVRYVGVGEGPDDLIAFCPEQFAAALLAEPADGAQPA